MSGSRTLPNLSREDDLDAATTSINVSKSAVLQAQPVDAVLDDLEQRSSVAKPVASAPSPRPTHPTAPSGGTFLLALLVLIAAGGAAAVVYFALPYFT